MNPASSIEHPASSPKSDTLFGGRTVSATFNDGTTADVKVRQLPLADYEKAFGLLADEMALTALICGQSKEWILGQSSDDRPASSASTLDTRPSTLLPGVAPESYEALHAAAWEVNVSGFFAWSVRRAEREQQAQAQMMHALAALPPEAIDQITQLGLAATRKDTLPTSSPKRR